jgi:hypothetical protein
LIADIINSQGKMVGYCIVELLPGAWDPEKNWSDVYLKNFKQQYVAGIALRF